MPRYRNCRTPGVPGKALQCCGPDNATPVAIKPPLSAALRKRYSLNREVQAIDFTKLFFIERKCGACQALVAARLAAMRLKRKAT